VEVAALFPAAIKRRLERAGLVLWREWLRHDPKEWKVVPHRLVAARTLRQPPLARGARSRKRRDPAPDEQGGYPADRWEVSASPRSALLAPLARLRFGLEAGFLERELGPLLHVLVEARRRVQVLERFGRNVAEAAMRGIIGEAAVGRRR